VAVNDPLVIVTELEGNYPNPFNPETTISFSVAQNYRYGSDGSPFVTLEIFNIRGEKVKTLINEKLPAGNHQIIWNGKDDNNKSVSSGIYFYKMNTDEYSAIKRLILLR
jgi:flagellar hook assembly protein FlgD